MSATHRATLVVAVAVMAAGCANEIPTSPSALIAPASRPASARSATPTLFSNAVKYSDKGRKPSTGRSGSAALNVFALLGRDHLTTLDVSAASSGDPTTMRGTLKKVQIKHFDPNGALQSTENHKDNLGSRASFVLPGRVRGANIQVQANISGIDPKRTDVVTVMGTVALRPDLSVPSISAPAEAVRNMPVTFSATVSEINGDVGARADCVLLENGDEIDRAPGIWVDAGGTVSCTFTEAFATVGTRTLRVIAANVNPGDYDEENNSAFHTIVVRDPAPPSTRNDFYWQGDVMAFFNYVQHRRSSGYWRDETGGHEEWSYEDLVRRNDYRAAVLSGSSPKGITGPVTARYIDEIDGTVLDDETFGGSWDDWQNVWDYTYDDPTLGLIHYVYSCISMQRTTNAIQEGHPVVLLVSALSVCTIRYLDNPQAANWSQSWFSYVSQAGDVSYYANLYDHYVSGDGGYEYTYSFNGDVDYSYGVFALGSTFRMSLTVTGADDSLIGNVAVPLSPEHVSWSYPEQCGDWTWDDTFEHSCFSDEGSYDRLHGQAVAEPSP